MTAIKMLDVSSNNHENDTPFDWPSVAKAGYGAVMIKATEGVSYVNEWLQKDADGAHAAGLHVGYYHYAVPNVTDAKQQAQFIGETIKGLPRDIGVSLDLEIMGGYDFAGLDEWARPFFDNLPDDVAEKTLYTPMDWAGHLPLCTSRRPMWVPSWYRRPRGICWAWQSGQAPVMGIGGLVDVGIYYG